MKTQYFLLKLSAFAVMLIVFAQCKIPPPCTMPILPKKLAGEFKVREIQPCTDQYGNPIEVDNLIIHFPPGMTDAQIQVLRDTYAPQYVDSCLCDPRLQNWAWDTIGDFNIEETVSQLTKDPKREGLGFSAHLNYVVNAFNPIEQGSHDTSMVKDHGEYSTPTGKIIAILDTGLDTFYASKGMLTLYSSDGTCAPSGTRGWNFIEKNADIFDDNGHGTAVTSIIATTLGKASENNEYHCGARFLILKTLKANGTGNMFDAICALQYAKEAGAEVINLSWGYYQVDNDFFRDRIFGAPSTSGEYPVMVASMGNDGERNIGAYRHFPSDYSLVMEHVISVGGDTRGNIWEKVEDRQASPAGLTSFSNYRLPQLIITGPSNQVSVWGVDPSGQVIYKSTRGTSFSTAFVTAEVAIALCCESALTSKGVRAKLRGISPVNLTHNGQDVQVKNIVVEQTRICADAAPSDD